MATKEKSNTKSKSRLYLILCATCLPIISNSPARADCEKDIDTFSLVASMGMTDDASKQYISLLSSCRDVLGKYTNEKLPNTSDAKGIMNLGNILLQRSAGTKGIGDTKFQQNNSPSQNLNALDGVIDEDISRTVNNATTDLALANERRIAEKREKERIERERKRLEIEKQNAIQVAEQHKRERELAYLQEREQRKLATNTTNQTTQREYNSQNQIAYNPNFTQSNCLEIITKGSSRYFYNHCKIQIHATYCFVNPGESDQHFTCGRNTGGVGPKPSSTSHIGGLEGKIHFFYCYGKLAGNVTWNGKDLVGVCR